VSSADDAAILEGLAPDEREAALRLLQKADLEGHEKVLGPVLGMDFERSVVPVRQWLEDDYYMGDIGRSLYPKLKDDLVEMFEGDYHEVLISGAIGWGKSFFAKLATVRSIYELSCLRDPQRAMGLSPDSLISLVAISVKVDIAKRSLLESMAQMMALSPYFVREFQPKVTKESIRFPKGIDLAPAAATNNNVLGLNVFGGILDESAFLGGMTEQQKKDMRRFGFVDRSEILYTLLLRRMKSRYLQRGGKLPGKLFLVSSKRTTNDFIERRIRDARREGGVFIREYNRWAVKPDAFGTKRFWVLVGNEQHHSRILSDKDDPDQYRHLEGAQLHQVPEELRSSFEKDLDNAIRDDLGVSTVAVSPFIGRREKIEDALEPGRIHPFSVLEWEAGTVATFRWQYLVRRNPENGENEPLCCVRAPRHAHIDGSLTGDATGLAVAHVHGFKDMERADRSSGSTFIERAPIVKVDFCLRIVPPAGDEIILSDVRVLIYDLAKHGMRILYVSMDAWQCLAKGTLVNTGRGLVPVEEVVAGDIVQSRVGPRRVLKGWAFGKRPTLRVTTEDGHIIEGTAKHRIEAQAGWGPEHWTEYGHTRNPVWAWRRLDECQIGDVVHLVDDPTEVDPDYGGYPLRRNDKNLLGWGRAGRGAIAAFEFPMAMTVSLAEWLGLVWGDGDIGRDSVRLSVTEEESSDARAVFERLFGVRPKFRPHKDRNCGILGIHARWLVRWLAANSLVKPLIPTAILRSNRLMKAAFLRGLFATDGTVNRRDGGVSLSTKHLGLARQVQIVLRTDFGIASCITTIDRSQTKSYVKEGFQYTLSVRGAREKFLNRVGFTYSRKQEALRKHIAVKGRRLFSKIIHIEPSEAEVFDLQVEDDPSYIANGFVSHNSAEGLQQLRQNGYRAEVVSVDRTTVPYELLKAALYEDRLLLYPYPPLQDELRRLEHDRRKGKVDHPSAGAKDLSDAVAACVYTLSSSDAAVRANLPAEAMGPSLGISVDPDSPAATGDFVEGPDGQMIPVEDWEHGFQTTGDFGLPSAGGSNGAIVAPSWMLSGKGRVPTLPLQKGARQVP
jgi:hypothetical protein